MKSMLLHVAETGHKHCGCGGYHYPHRPGSPYCWLNPMSAYHDAARRGESADTLTDILIDLIWDGKAKQNPLTGDCPF